MWKGLSYCGGVVEINQSLIRFESIDSDSFRNLSPLFLIQKFRAARRRWQEKGIAMKQTATRGSEAATCGRKAVRMYPNNELKAQVREFGTNLSAFTVMKDAFTDAK